MTIEKHRTYERYHVQFRLRDREEELAKRTLAGESKNAAAKWMVEQYLALVNGHLTHNSVIAADHARQQAARQ